MFIELLIYFVTSTFLQKISNKNSKNREQKRTNHCMGSKSFSKLSDEKVKLRHTFSYLLKWHSVYFLFHKFELMQYILGILERSRNRCRTRWFELWRSTHMRNGRWSDEASQAVYVSNAVSSVLCIMIHNIIWIFIWNTNSIVVVSIRMKHFSMLQRHVLTKRL